MIYLTHFITSFRLNFVAESLVELNNLTFRSWTILEKVMDHNSIALQVEGEYFALKFPFKFNQSWIKDDSFCNMVREERDSMDSFES